MLIIYGRRRSYDFNNLIQIQSKVLIANLINLIYNVGEGGGGWGVGRGDTLCPRQILLFAVKVSGISRKLNFQRIPKIYQGFWIKQIFFQKFFIQGVVVYLFAPSLKSEKWRFYRFTNRKMVLQLLLNYKHISLVFSKY